MKSEQCPAKNAQCCFCHKMGHYESVSMTKQQSLEASTAHSGTKVQSGVSFKCIEPALNSVSNIPLFDKPFQIAIELCDSDGDNMC